MQKKERSSFLTGFRLVDYAIAVICIGILIAMFFPFYGSGRGPVRRSMCLNNMRQLILACHNYQSSHLNFPSASGTADQNVGASFLVCILPFLDQQSLHDEYQDGIKFTPLPEVLKNLSNNKVDLLYCQNEMQQSAPDIDGVSQFTTHYYASLGPNSDPDGVGYQFSYSSEKSKNQAIGLNGVFSPWSSAPADPETAAIFDHKYGKKFDDMRDGSSNTIALFESSRSENKKKGIVNLRRGWAFGHTTAEDDSNIEFVNSGKSLAHKVNPATGSFGWNDQPISSNHAGGAQVAMADGSAKFISEDISIELLRAASSIDDGEPDDLE